MLPLSPSMCCGTSDMFKIVDVTVFPKIWTEWVDFLPSYRCRWGSHEAESQKGVSKRAGNVRDYARTYRSEIEAENGVQTSASD